MVAISKEVTCGGVVKRSQTSIVGAVLEIALHTGLRVFFSTAMGQSLNGEFNEAGCRMRRYRRSTREKSEVCLPSGPNKEIVAVGYTPSRLWFRPFLAPHPLDPSVPPGECD